MTRIHSLIALPKNPTAMTNTALHANSRRMALCTSVVLTPFIVGACSQEAASDTALSGATEPNNRVVFTRQKQQDVLAIENNIRNAYARLASKRVDVCPKLIQEEVGASVIERRAELMLDSHCDYFLYPQIGQHIMVTTTDIQIKSALIVPTIHNFANGYYKVSSYDKHVVRLAYNGASHKPKHFNYDVTIRIID